MDKLIIFLQVIVVVLSFSAFFLQTSARRLFFTTKLRCKIPGKTPSGEVWLGCDGFCKCMGRERGICDNYYQLVYLKKGFTCNCWGRYGWKKEDSCGLGDD